MCIIFNIHKYIYIIGIIITLILTAAKRDPGVPNSLPFKEEILKEAEINKKRVSK